MNPARPVTVLLAMLAALGLPAQVPANEVGAARASAPAAAGARTAKPAAAEATASAPAAPPAVTDPLEHLRQRLAERMTGARTADAGKPYDLRVRTTSSPAPRVPTGAKPAAKKVVPGAASAAKGDAHGAQAHWGYEGPAGPQTWGGLKPEFALCGIGQRQSPIDIRGGLPVELEPVQFEYQPTRFGVVDNGHTVQVNFATGNRIDVGGRRFELRQLHFHRPSEERIDGRQFEMSVHLVHQDEQGRLAVVAVLLDRGQAQPLVQKVWNNLPLEKNEENAARIELDASDILPADRRYYTYMGSLTTPPCTEGVQWIVMRQPVSLSAEQIELFARIYPMNARPVQQPGGRRILQSE